MNDFDRKNFEELKKSIANKDTILFLDLNTRRILSLYGKNNTNNLHAFTSAIASEIYRRSRGAIDPNQVYNELKVIINKYIDEVDRYERKR